MKHPAKFSDNILERVIQILDAYGWPKLTLDPFGGVGRVHEIADLNVVTVDLEPEWAADAGQLAVAAPGECLHASLVANALDLPFADDTFDSLITSPTYGNRFADHHDARDGSLRRSYKHDLGRDLHPANSGQLHWGPEYRTFHEAAWAECLRVLKTGALLLVNVSDHIRKREVVRVVEWHLRWFADHGCTVEAHEFIQTRRMKYGANPSRVPTESLLVLRYESPMSPGG